MDPEQTKAAEKYPVPTNLKSLQRFLGMAGWFHRFVPKFSEIAEPLNALKRKDTKFRWTTDCQTAFEILKQCLVKTPVLGNPTFNLPFVVYMDGSEVGLSAVLVQQKGMGTEKVFAFTSRSLNKAERNYFTTEHVWLLYGL